MTGDSRRSGAGARLCAGTDWMEDRSRKDKNRERREQGHGRGNQATGGRCQRSQKRRSGGDHEGQHCRITRGRLERRRGGAALALMQPQMKEKPGRLGVAGPFVAAQLSLKNPKILATRGTWVAQRLK